MHRSYPALLTLSLDGNLRPTVDVLRRAGLLEAAAAEPTGAGPPPPGAETAAEVKAIARAASGEANDGAGTEAVTGAMMEGRGSRRGRISRRPPLTAKTTALRPRHLAASLTGRVLPRLAFCEALRRRRLDKMRSEAEGDAVEEGAAGDAADAAAAGDEPQPALRPTLSAVTSVSDATFAKQMGAQPSEYVAFREELLRRKQAPLSIDWFPEELDLSTLLLEPDVKPRPRRP